MLHTITCQRCGIDFTARNANRVYCGVSCSGSAWSGSVNPKRARDGRAKAPRGGERYMKARAALKARGDAYCWRGCGTYLLVDAPQGHPQFMTLGHVIAWEDDPSLFWNEENHMPECGPCNFSDGARRTNSKRGNPHHPGRNKQRQYRNPEWYEAYQVGKPIALAEVTTRPTTPCPACGQLTRRPKYCSDRCLVEMSARSMRDRYRAKVGIPVDSAMPVRPRVREAFG